MRRTYRRIEHPVENAFRVSWGRRIETGLGVGFGVVTTALAHLPVPGVSETLLALGAGTLIMAAPTRTWLVEAVRRERTGRLFAQAAVDVGVAPAEILALKAVPSGNRLTLSLSPGSIAEDYDKAAEALAVCFRSRDVRVLRNPANAGRAELTIVTCDPLAGAGTPWPWVTAHRTSLWGGPSSGTRRGRRATCALDLAGHHVLVGGEPGAGKSNALSMIVAAAALDPHRRAVVPRRQAGGAGPLAGRGQGLRRSRHRRGHGRPGRPPGRDDPPLRVAAQSETAQGHTRHGSRPRARGRRRTGPLHPGQGQGTGRVRPGTAGPGGPGPGGRHRGGGRHPEAGRRRGAHGRAGPLRLPPGAALFHPRGLRHRSRVGLGSGRLQRCRHRPGHPGCGAALGRGRRAPDACDATT
jgi:hypothetical protein